MAVKLFHANYYTEEFSHSITSKHVKAQPLSCVQQVCCIALSESTTTRAFDSYI